MKPNADRAERTRNGHGAEPGSSQREEAAAAMSGASQELHDFIADLEELIQATTSLTGEDLARAKAKLYDRIAAARQAAGHLRRGVIGRTRHRIRVVNNYVQEQPWKSLGIGVAAGLVVGLIMSRRRA
jgi:ElaB/YqjD/DUF883 family membrane-anchored ribosome-binding protein